MKEVKDVPADLNKRYGTTRSYQYCLENDIVLGEFCREDSLEYLRQLQLDSDYSDDDSGLPFMNNGNHGNYTVGGSSGSNCNCQQRDLHKTYTNISIHADSKYWVNSQY